MFYQNIYIFLIMYYCYRKMKIKYTANFLIWIMFILCVWLCSCSTTKKTTYFQDVPDSGKISKQISTVYTEPVIQIDDILTIIVETADPLATQVINAGNVTTVNNGNVLGTNNYNPQSSSGYLVDKSGYVDIPVLGKIKLAGYTTMQARDAIRAIAAVPYKNPTVIVRFANFKISVAGEVARPGTYIMPNEKVSLLDAITMAGDLTIYGKRDNVLLMREEADGSRSWHRFNLKNSDIISSPYFYLHQNDYIYVVPNQSKAAANDAGQVRTYTIIGSLLSVLIIFLTRK